MSSTVSENGANLRSQRCDISHKRTLSASPVCGTRRRSKSPVNLRKVLKERRCQSLVSNKNTRNVDRNKLDTTSTNEKFLKISNFSDSQDPVIPYSIVNRVQHSLVAKKRELIRLKKSMIASQNVVIEAYASVREMEFRVGNSSEESVGDIQLVSVTGWPPHDLLLLLRPDIDVLNPNQTDSNVGGVFGPEILQQLHSQLYSIPDEVLGLGTDLISIATEMINAVHRQRGERVIVTKNLSSKTKNTPSLIQIQSMQNLVESSSQNLKAKFSYVLKLAKMPWLDRDILVRKLEKVTKENLILQNKVDELKRGGDDSQRPTSQNAPYQAAIEELQRERTARDGLKLAVADAENMLRIGRARVSALERQLKETKTELETLRSKHKDLETLYRHRETTYGVRSKKLLEVSKTGEITIETLAKQRDAFELRVKELRERADFIQKAAEKREASEKSIIDSLRTKLNEQDKYRVEAENKVKELEFKLKEVQQSLKALREKSLQSIEFQQRTCLEYIPSKETEPSDAETSLWQELQQTRAELARTAAELKQSRADKDNFLKSISKIAQVGGGGGNTEDTLVEELVEKEKQIFELEHKIEDLKDNEKNMERHMIKYENQLAALRTEVHRLRNYDCYVKDMPNQELETELTQLQIQVQTLCRERSALLTAAASRALMLERHERAADLFANITRVRRDLAANLAEEPELALNQDRFAEVSSSLPSTVTSAAETWTALRAERARVLRLEGAVLAQSWQLQREAKVRTQLERRRAALQRVLLTGNDTPDM